MEPVNQTTWWPTRKLVAAAASAAFTASVFAVLDGVSPALSAFVTEQGWIADLALIISGLIGGYTVQDLDNTPDAT